VASEQEAGSFLDRPPAELAEECTVTHLSGQTISRGHSVLRRLTESSLSITRKKADKLLAELVRRAAMRPSSRASGWKRYAKYTDAQNALTWTITKK
jgi:hypothetical protein